MARTNGLSLIEVTIMLLVLMLLTSVLAPAIFDFVKDAQWVKVKEDCEAIGVSIARLVRDVGCIKIDGTLPCGAGLVNSPSWLAGGPYPNPFALSETDPHSLDGQLVTNAPLYLEPVVPVFGPSFNKGWRGAYLSPPVASDPWGGPYLVGNTDHFSAPGLGGEDDVVCLSYGPDGAVSSLWTAGGGIARKGDDFIVVISGNPR